MSVTTHFKQRVEPLEPVEVELRQLGRADLPRADQGRQLGDRQEGQLLVRVGPLGACDSIGRRLVAADALGRPDAAGSGRTSGPAARRSRRRPCAAPRTIGGSARPSGPCSSRSSSVRSRPAIHSACLIISGVTGRPGPPAPPGPGGRSPSRRPAPPGAFRTARRLSPVGRSSPVESRSLSSPMSLVVMVPYVLASYLPPRRIGPSYCVRAGADTQAIGRSILSRRPSRPIVELGDWCRYPQDLGTIAGVAGAADRNPARSFSRDAS